MSGIVSQSTWQLPPGALRAAFDDVARDGARGEFVPIVGLPSEFMHHRRERQRRIGGTAGDHDIRARVQRFGQRKRADVSVGGEDLLADRPDRFAGIHVAHLIAFRGEFVEAVENVVAVHHRDLQSGRGFQHGLRAGSGIHAAGVGNDFDTAFMQTLRPAGRSEAGNRAHSRALDLPASAFAGSTW